jgi:hypothetical protein
MGLARRTDEELNSQERRDRVAKLPGVMPRYLREFIRKQFAESAIEFLVDTMTGEQTFPMAIAVNVKGGGQTVEIVEVGAPAIVRKQAAVDLLNIAIPRQAGLVDDEGNSQTGVVLLPPLDGEGTHGEDHGGREIIEEEVGLEGAAASKEDRDEAPGPIEEVVRPELVKHVLAQRRARGVAGNGHSPRGAKD